MEMEIRALKIRKNAIIMAHNYQPLEIQALADVVGDSLELAVRAKEAKADLIVVCGVRFMAETAKILNPERKVVIPVPDAGCPLADFLTPEMIREAKERHPDAAVVVYVNSTAESKALADVTCTSANAVKVVASLKNDTILFGPDSNLAAYVQRELPEKTIIPLPPGGHCYVHTGFTLADVEAARRKGSMVVCHPECRPEIQEQADLVASTGGSGPGCRQRERALVGLHRAGDGLPSPGALPGQGLLREAGGGLCGYEEDIPRRPPASARARGA